MEPNEAQPMIQQPVVRGAKIEDGPITWGADDAEAPARRKRLTEAEEARLLRDAEFAEHRRAVDRLAEFPTLLRYASDPDAWGQLRVEQLVMCGMSQDAAISRAMLETANGCLGTFPVREQEAEEDVECEIAPAEDSLAGDDRGEH